MALRQVHHMDVVAHARAVRRIIVVSKDAYALQLSDGHLRHVGNQIVRDSFGILADEAALMGSDGIEVAQKHHLPVVVGHIDILQHLLQHALGLAVGVRAFSLRALLRDGHKGRISVYGRRGAEHDVLHAMLSHHIAEHQGSRDIIIVILDGLGHRLAYRLQARKMNDRVDLLLVEDRVHSLPVQDVRLVKGHMLSGDLLHTVKRLFAGIIQVVYYYHIVAGFQEFYTGVASDKARTARYQNCHLVLPPDFCIRRTRSGAPPPSSSDKYTMLSGPAQARTTLFPKYAQGKLIFC